MSDRDRWLAVAGAVADGEAVDWDAVGGREPRDGQVLAALRTLHGLLARSVREAPADTAAGPRIPRTQLAVMALAAVQAAVALGSILAHAALGRSGPGSEALPAAVVATLAGAATLLVSSRARDARTIALGAFFLAAASAPSHRLMAGLPESVRAAAWPLLGPGVYPEAFMPFFLWSFARLFPRTLRFSVLDRLCHAGVRLSLALGVVLFGANLVVQFADAWPGASLLRRSPTGAYWGLILGTMVPALVLLPARARLAPPAERRKVAVFLAGVAGGLAPLALTGLGEVLVPAYDDLTDVPRIWPIVDGLVFASLLVIPVVTTHAVLVQRVLPFRLVVHRTLTYLLARHTLTALLLAAAAVLARELYVQRDATLAAVLTSARSEVLLGALAACVLLLTLRGSLIAVLDRAFSRVRVNAGSVVAGAGRLMAAARGPGEIALHLEGAACDALALDRAALYVSARAAGAFLSPRGAHRRLAADTALARLLAEDEAAVDFSAPRGSLFGLLPLEDREWLADGQFAALVPLTGRGGTLAGFLAVGQRRSDEAFARDDLSLLSALCSSAALALEGLDAAALASAHASGADAVEHQASECAACGRVTAAAVSRCACGGALAPAAVPLQLAGKFVVEAVLGRGGMGVVYRGRDNALGRAVAIKTLPRVSPSAVVRMRREARAMASVTHQHLAVLYGLESWHGAPMLIQELLEGGTLALRLRAGRLPVTDVLDLGVQLAACLEYLHGEGLLHRDIKPSNIGFTRSGAPKLLDFGLASLLADDPRQGATRRRTEPDALADPAPGLTDVAVAGTPLYLSPEAARGEAPDASFDTWSLAMVLHEAIAGRHPFAAPTIAAVLERVRDSGVPPLTSLRPDCPVIVADAIADALAPRREQRPPTAAALGARLAAARGRSVFGSAASNV